MSTDSTMETQDVREFSVAAPVGDDSVMRNAAAVSFGQAAVMVFGGLLALLVAREFGKTAVTDAFFAAYGLYAVAVVFGQSMRLTAIPRLVADANEYTTDRMLAAVLLMSSVAIVPMVVFAEPIGRLLVPGDPDGIAGESLRALWPALAGQLALGVLAAVAVVRRRFKVMAFGYLMTGIANIVVFLALKDTIGIQSVSVALGFSTLLLVMTIVVSVARDGWRPHLPAYRRLRHPLSDSIHLTLSSASFLAANLGYIICVAVTARLGVGAPTIYAYAYLASSLLVGTTAVSAAMVRAPILLDERGGGSVAAAHAVSSFRFSLIVIAPVLALVALIGQPVFEAVLGTGFAGQGAADLVSTMLALSGWVIGSAVSVLAVLELVHRGRFVILAWVALAQTAVLPVAAIFGRELIGIEGVAIAQSLTVLGAAVAQIGAAFGDQAVGCLKSCALATVRSAAIAAAAIGPGIVLLDAFGRSTTTLIAVAVMALVIMVGLTRLLWRSEFAVLTSALTRRSLRPSTAEA